VVDNRIGGDEAADGWVVLPGAEVGQPIGVHGAANKALLGGPAGYAPPGAAEGGLPALGRRLVAGVDGDHGSALGIGHQPAHTRGRAHCHQLAGVRVVAGAAHLAARGAEPQLGAGKIERGPARIAADQPVAVVEE
jgi:hypothetical protein